MVHPRRRLSTLPNLRALGTPRASSASRHPEPSPRPPPSRGTWRGDWRGSEQADHQVRQKD
eukprot:2294981-Alexandrium_andersonii.AAC.1